MDSLNDILLSKDFTEPKEAAAIKLFVKKRFDESANVQVQKNSIVIVVRSSALAGSLRQLSPQLQEAAGTKLRLVFRIG